MIERINKHCSYFPCHEKLEDCTFCYCPYYPCLDATLGQFVVDTEEKDVWSCEHCTYIHRREVVDKMHQVLRENRRVKKTLPAQGVE